MGSKEVVRASALGAQEMCALLELAAPIESVGMDSKEAIALIAGYADRLKSQPKSWPMGVRHPDEKARSGDHWMMVVPVMPYDQKGVYHNENALFVAQSTDKVAFLKAMANVVIAHSQIAKFNIKTALGVPSQLARYGMIWDSVISTVGGESGGKSLGEAAHASDTFVFKEFPEDKRKSIPAEDQSIWFPFVLFAWHSLGRQTDPDKIAAHLETQWKGTKWSREMIIACITRLPKFT